MHLAGAVCAMVQLRSMRLWYRSSGVIRAFSSPAGIRRKGRAPILGDDQPTGCRFRRWHCGGNDFERSVVGQRYEETLLASVAPAAASEACRWPRLSNAKPNGVRPANRSRRLRWGNLGSGLVDSRSGMDRECFATISPAWDRIRSRNSAPQPVDRVADHTVRVHREDVIETA